MICKIKKEGSIKRKVGRKVYSLFKKNEDLDKKRRVGMNPISNYSLFLLNYPSFLVDKVTLEDLDLYTPDNNTYALRRLNKIHILQEKYSLTEMLDKVDQDVAEGIVFDLDFWSQI